MAKTGNSTAVLAALGSFHPTHQWQLQLSMRGFSPSVVRSCEIAMPANLVPLPLTNSAAGGEGKLRIGPRSPQFSVSDEWNEVWPDYLALVPPQNG